MADFVNTSTNEKYPAGNWTNFNATDAVTNVGRFRAQNSGTASYNWSIAVANTVSRPIYETDWLTWQPVYSAEVGTWTSVTTGIAKYKIEGSELSFFYDASGTTSSTPVYLDGTLPFDSNVSNSLAFSGRIVDGGSGITGQIFLQAGTPDKIRTYKSDGTSLFGTGAGRTAIASGFYGI